MTQKETDIAWESAYFLWLVTLLRKWSLTDVLEKVVISVTHGGPRLTFLRKWSHFASDAGPQLAFLMFRFGVWWRIKVAGGGGIKKQANKITLSIWKEFQLLALDGLPFVTGCSVAASSVRLILAILNICVFLHQELRAIWLWFEIVFVFFTILLNKWCWAIMKANVGEQWMKLCASKWWAPCKPGVTKRSTFFLCCKPF